ncbi:hypothetical protein THAOC_29915 [Thalassiosira oceanica]|uniref:Uncharacterized protein n=1 Tax=Thalassiosira oceanica TaxID=159749 RepID=K0RPZ8_THAOC|nr:hypothetical protein THAOC_29915 [Thalassiosira oceanica]|eukprot:EJK50966.1 hypothetical protein THAOC_29915 [Thalassiosira oceanica]
MVAMVVMSDTIGTKKLQMNPTANNTTTVVLDVAVGLTLVNETSISKFHQGDPREKDLLAIPKFLPSFTSHSWLVSFAAGEAVATATSDTFCCSPEADAFGSLMISSLFFGRVVRRTGTEEILDSSV